MKSHAGGLPVLVTGTSRGIGHGIASRLLREGRTVVGMSRHVADIFHDDYYDVQVDLSSAEELGSAFDVVIMAHGGIAGLVNNAGAITYGNCWELSGVEFDRLLDLNLTAPFLLTQLAIRHWIEVGSEGVIVNICSIESDVAIKTPPQAGYAITKGGLVGLTRATALEFADQGIRINGLAPGVIATDLSPIDDLRLMHRIPMGRAGTVDEVAGVASFLLSSDASYMTGEIIYMDGGYRVP